MKSDLALLYLGVWKMAIQKISAQIMARPQDARCMRCQMANTNQSCLQFWRVVLQLVG